MPMHPKVDVARNVREGKDAIGRVLCGRVEYGGDCRASSERQGDLVALPARGASTAAC